MVRKHIFLLNSNLGIDSLSISFIMSTFLTVMFVAKFFHESEAAFCEIYSMNKDNEKEKIKWMSVLETIPFYVVIYDKMKEKISYIN